MCMNKTLKETLFSSVFMVYLIPCFWMCNFPGKCGSSVTNHMISLIIEIIIMWAKQQKNFYDSTWKHNAYLNFLLNFVFMNIFFHVCK